MKNLFELSRDSRIEVDPPRGMTVKEFLKYAIIATCAVVVGSVFFHEVFVPKPFTQWYQPRKSQYLTSAEDHEVKLWPVGAFRKSGTVLAKARVNDEWGDVSPYDVAIAWGNYLNPETHKALEPRLKDRCLYWVTPTPKDTLKIITSTANIHLIPANQFVLESIKAIQPGELIHIEGTTVDVQRENNSWRSSRSEFDTGFNSGEIVFVRNIKRSWH